MAIKIVTVSELKTKLASVCPSYRPVASQYT